jgi:hypothetical protein
MEGGDSGVKQNEEVNKGQTLFTGSSFKFVSFFQGKFSLGCKHFFPKKYWEQYLDAEFCQGRKKVKLFVCLFFISSLSPSPFIF